MNAVLVAVLVFCMLVAMAAAGVLGFILWRQYKRNKVPMWRCVVSFAHGIKSTLVLNDEQHKQFIAWLDTTEGYYEIADAGQGVRLYREYVAMVELKRV